MAEARPIFALDLSNDGIALWHRGGGTGWTSLGHIPLDARDMQSHIQLMRAKVGIIHNKPLKAVIRIPRSEVMMSRLKLGVFEGDAATSQARKLISELTPYAINEIVYDLDAKGVGNMAPVAIAARETLQEAQDFAARHGFTAIYFTTQFELREFPREPRFYLTPPKKPILPLLSRIAAAAAIGLAAGYFGYTNFLAPTSTPTQPIAQAELPVAEPVVAQPEPEAVAEAPAIPDIDLAIEPDFSAPQTATLIAPQTTDYPVVLLDDVGRSSIARLYRLARPKDQQGTPKPAYEAETVNHKTDALALADALRDLPDLALGDDVLAAQAADMALANVAEHRTEPPLEVASFTQPDTAFGEIVNSRLIEPAPSYVSPPQDARQPADPPPLPPAPVIAEPGTLIPTPEGTLGPENILIFSGQPPVFARSRPVVAPPPDPLAGFRPRLRPDGIAQLAILALPQVIEQPDQLTALTPNEAPPQTPERQPGTVANQNPTVPQLPAAQQPDPIIGPVQQPPVVSLLALADPALADRKARARPAGLAPLTPPQEPEEPETLLLQADPALAGIKARTRPENLVAQAEPEEAPSLLALADPTLATKRPQTRPANLAIPIIAETDTPILQADPALSGFRAKKRPTNLEVIQPKIEDSAVSETVNTLASATKQAVANSLKPRKRPADLAILASLTSGGKTTGNIAKPGTGTSKPSAIPTRTTVAKAATERSRFNKRKMNLVGVFGTPNARRALVRLPSGRYVKVKAGDRLSGWKVSAIGESSLRIIKGSKNQVLRMP